MLLIPCPWCGAREQTEFSYHGEAHIVRPENPDALSDVEWADYLFFRQNTRGMHAERWMHAAGCRRFFNLARHTVNGTIAGAYRIGDSSPVPPPVPSAQPPAAPVPPPAAPSAQPSEQPTTEK